VSENRALRRISRPKGKEVPEGRRTLKNEVFHNICSFSNITTRLNQRGGDGQTSSTSGLLKKCRQRRVGKPQEKNHLRELDVDMRITPKWSLYNSYIRM
jgi:hypothetical protein